jgi:hypothetical protein
MTMIKWLESLLSLSSMIDAKMIHETFVKTLFSQIHIGPDSSIAHHQLRLQFSP